MTSFLDFGLNQDLIQAIEDLNFVQPTPVQEQAIPYLLNESSDLIALAQTGTGKTAAFGLPMLNTIDLKARVPQALVLCPTRELCMQIVRDFESFSKYMPGLQTVAVYGGSSIRTQIDQLKRGCQIVVATPGRLMDLMERRAVNLREVSFAVLDEADEMLNMGFREDMEFILGELPEHRTCLFSATMSKDVRHIADRFLQKDAHTISIGKSNASARNITHQFAVVHQKDKYQALKRMLDALPGFYGIVFCTTKMETQDISDKLTRDGYQADCMHGDLSQSQREKTLARFRHGSVKILLATDVAARGIDVSDLTHVIHYHLPEDIENYTHRSGRTARAGKSGISIALLNVKEFYKIRRIEQASGVRFERYMIPKGEDLVRNLTQKLVDDIELAEIPETGWHVEAIEALAAFEPKKLAAKLVQQILGHVSADPEMLPDLNVYDRAKGDSSGSSDGYGHTKLFISLGAKDRLNPSKMKELVVAMSEINPAQISSVAIKDTYSFLMVSPEAAEQVVTAMHGGTYADRPIRIEATEGSSGRSRNSGRFAEKNSRGGSSGYRTDKSDRGGFRSERSDRGGDRSYGKGPRKKDGDAPRSGGRNSGFRSR